MTPCIGGEPLLPRASGCSVEGRDTIRIDHLP